MLRFLFAIFLVLVPVRASQADTPFTTYAFPSSQPSETTARTDPARWGDIINVKSYGAVGDGITDDTAAIQAAMNAAANLHETFSGGNTVYFPPGTYKITCGTVNPYSGLLAPTGASGNQSVLLWGGGSTGAVSAVYLQGNCPNAYVVDMPDFGGANFTRKDSTTYLPGMSGVLWGGHTTASGNGSGSTFNITSTNGITAGTSTANATSIIDVTQSNTSLGYVTNIATNTLTMSASAAGVVNGDTLAFSGPQVFGVVSSQTNGVVGSTASSSPSISGLTVGQTVTDGAVTWVLLATTPTIVETIAGIQGMTISNTSTTSGGAVRLDNMLGGAYGLHDVQISGFNGLHMANNVFGINVDACAVTGGAGQDGVYGSYGIIAGQVYIKGCTISGFWVGVTSYNDGVHIDGGHVENNSTAIQLGIDPTGAASSTASTIITGVPFERDNIDIDIKGVCGACVISANSLTGVVATFVTAQAPGGAFTGNIHNGTQIIDGMNSTAGLAVNNPVSCTGCGVNAKVQSVDSQVQIHVTVASTASTNGVTLTFTGTPYAGILNENGAGCEYCVIEANSCSMYASDACFDFSNGSGLNNVIQGNNANIGGGTGVAWSMPSTNAAGFTFINNNSPWNDVGMVPASQSVLPSCGSATSGRHFPITDAGSTTFNAAIGSGSSHVEAYCDGTSYKVH